MNMLSHEQFDKLRDLGVSEIFYTKDGVYPQPGVKIGDVLLTAGFRQFDVIRDTKPVFEKNGYVVRVTPKLPFLTELMTWEEYKEERKND